jgi:hypothetical protein
MLVTNQDPTFDQDAVLKTLVRNEPQNSKQAVVATQAVVEV